MLMQTDAHSGANTSPDIQTPSWVSHKRPAPQVLEINVVPLAAMELHRFTPAGEQSPGVCTLTDTSRDGIAGVHMYAHTNCKLLLAELCRVGWDL